MRGGKVEVFADITGYVRHLVETSNREVVRYENGLLRGVSPGKATVKVSGGVMELRLDGIMGIYVHVVDLSNLIWDVASSLGNDLGYTLLATVRGLILDLY
mgnify:FL=1